MTIPAPLDPEVAPAEPRRGLRLGHVAVAVLTALDAAALRLGPVTRFHPAAREGCAIPVWVAFPVTFQVVGQA